MDDDKYFTIQVKGEAYRFMPIAPEDFERVALVQSMSVDSAKFLKVLTRTLANSAVDDSWDRLTDRWMNQELTTPEATVDIFKVLIERQQAEEKKAKAPKRGRTGQPKGLDVASDQLTLADAG